MRGLRHWRWHLDEMYVRLNGEMIYLWRAVDHEGRGPGKLRHPQTRQIRGSPLYEEGAEAGTAKLKRLSPTGCVRTWLR
ncbi:MAG: DDE-type integrase/transposase/recombinase [Novosphingobium sp.]